METANGTVEHGKYGKKKTQKHTLKVKQDGKIETLKMKGMERKKH